MMRSTRI